VFTLFYCAGQFLGALTGLAVAAYVLGGALGNAAAHYGVTAPGAYGDDVAFVAEVIISFALMGTILSVSERENLSRYTPYFAGALVAACTAFESPLSGSSRKPGTIITGTEQCYVFRVGPSTRRRSSMREASAERMS
jgi:aquaporin Z